VTGVQTCALPILEGGGIAKRDINGKGSPFAILS
jgi:hypothetical protein